MRSAWASTRLARRNAPANSGFILQHFIDYAQIASDSTAAAKPHASNPFNPSTTISYRLARTEDVRLEVFDVMGRRVATLVEDPQPAGTHEVRFDASGLASGVYVYRLSSASTATVRTMLLLR